MSRLSALDALFLYAEDGVSHMHIGSCALFAGPAPSQRAMAAQIERKLHLVPRFRQRVQFVPGQLGHPVWVDDESFAIDRHLHRLRLPAPGDETALFGLLARLMSDELDRDHALWQMWLVTGLASGEWALVTKAHHCMVDGVSGTDLMAAILDTEPRPVRAAPTPWTPAPPPGAVRLVVDGLRGHAGDVASTLGTVARGLGSPRRSWAVGSGVVSGLGQFARQLARPDRGLPVDGRLDARRRYSAARCSLADVRTIRRAFGGSVNDVVLAVIAGAMREVMVADGQVTPGTTVSSLVPVSIRANGDHTSNNQVSMMIAPLAVGIDDPVERLEVTRRTMAELKESHEVAAATAVFRLADAVPPPLLAAAIRGTETYMQRVSQRIVSTVTTNVAGPPVPLYALGREMREYLPFVPVGPGVRLGVAILSYNGRLAFGVTGDEGAGARAEQLARSIDSGMAQLVGLATTRGRSAS
ncbi:MAG: wax ester/triacylglycerol synthase family O-acyltransferase [Actinobacteria bacterium]|nr:wax ester/triacylglycerol synthase family O-acyltransferase [Actinomycetota bacterium]